jgi:hypothetical protein
MTMKTWPRWAVWTVAGVFLLIGGYGTYVKYAGNDVKPAPAPTPLVKTDIGEVWKSLDPPSTNSIPGLIELPPAMEVNASRRYIPITAKCDNEVRWLVSSQSGQPVDALESRAINSIMVFPRIGVDDLVVVVAYTAKENKPSNAVVTFIQIKADKPPPGPNPDPKPGPGPTPTPTPTPGQITKLHVTFLLDYTKQTPAIATIVNSKDLRSWLADKGHQVHELSIKENLKNLGLDELVKGKNPPLLILQTTQEANVKEGQVLLIDNLTSVQQVKEAVTKITGK